MLSIKKCTIETVEGKRLVEDVSLSVEEGKVAVLMGQNGSGKSTLANTLLGHPHYRLVSGDIVLDEESLVTHTVSERARKGLFLSLQYSPKIDGVTLAQFLHAAKESSTGTQCSALEFYLQMREQAQRYGLTPDLLDRTISAGLSGGEKKMSDLLQLVALRPRIAVLDEIDSGVDIDAIKRVFAAIVELKREGMGFLLISHHPSLLDHIDPDVVYVMGGGRMLRRGGREVAEDVLKNGFCFAGNCTFRAECTGACDDTCHHTG